MCTRNILVGVLDSRVNHGRQMRVEPAHFSQPCPRVYSATSACISDPSSFRVPTIYAASSSESPAADAKSRNLPEPGPDELWYFAFGANMNKSVLKRRGINPKIMVPATMPSKRLVFHHRGGYSSLIDLNPPNGSPNRDPGGHDGGSPADKENSQPSVPAAHGVLELLTRAEWDALREVEMGYLVRQDGQCVTYDKQAVQASWFETSWVGDRVRILIVTVPSPLVRVLHCQPSSSTLLIQYPNLIILSSL
eukprot:jgi/Mesvir1/2065/Mv02320-RA.2